MRLNPALLALAICAFAIGTTEFVIVGLLPTVAGDLRVGIAAAGLLVSGYALSAMVSAPALTAAARRVPRKAVLVAVMAVFAAGNAGAAAAPGFALLMAARVVTALAHGLFFSIGAPFAADLVPEERRAGAIALMLTGLTVSTVIGVPLGTWIGQAHGWRATFALVAALSVAALAAAAALIPATHASPPAIAAAGEAADWRGTARLLGQRRLTTVFAVTVLAYTGTYVPFTYLAAILERVNGFPARDVSSLLLAYGVAVVAGNAVGAHLTGRAAGRALLGIFLAQCAALAFYPALTAGRPGAGAALMLALLGLMAAMPVSALQFYVTQIARRVAPGGVDLVSALNVAAASLGIAAGSLLGGAVVERAGLAATLWVGAAVIALTAVAAEASRRMEAGAS